MRRTQYDYKKSNSIRVDIQPTEKQSINLLQTMHRLQW